MEIYDNIHGIIEIPQYIKNIIDTKEFQRLRKIKQLGLVYNVFISASHNRFEHSIGVYYLTNKYIEILQKFNKNIIITEQEHKLICIAALIHDIGHGPFSHLFDELTTSCHEYRSIKIFQYMNCKYNFNFTDDDIQFIGDIINPERINLLTKHKKFLYQIVSNNNGIDVDRMDYILRDIKMTGLNYGIEIEQIMKNSLIIQNENKQLEIIFKDKAYLQIQNFFWVRYTLYKNICNHITVRSLEAMIKDILILINPIFKITETIQKEDWENFILINDSIIDTAYFICQKDKTNLENQKIINLIDRINNRNLYRFKEEITSNKEIIEEKYSKLNNTDILYDFSSIKYLSKEKPRFENKILNLNNIYNENNTVDNKHNHIEFILKIFDKI